MVSKVNGYSVISSLFLIKIPQISSNFFYLGSMSPKVGLLAAFFILPCTSTSPIKEKVVLGGSPLGCITNLEKEIPVLHLTDLMFYLAKQKQINLIHVWLLASIFDHRPSNRSPH
jgi:hypothetical protein